MSVIIGSARIDENGHVCGGKAGDQTGREISTQDFYVSQKGWYVIRAKKNSLANKLAERMLSACKNNNIGYDQSERYGVIKNSINTKVKTEADCSSLVRACVKEASGIDPHDFNTESEVKALEKTKLFKSAFPYTSKTVLYTGDILVTKTKGHTVIVVDGAKRSSGKVALPVLQRSVIKNVEAKKLQKNLNSLGYKDFDGKKLETDGIFGSRTESALKGFQAHEGLTVDGIYGEKSYNAMCKCID